MNHAAARDLSQLAPLSAELRRRLQRVKAETGQGGFPWYPHDTLNNLDAIDRLLQGRFRQVLDGLQPDAPVLDIGCADGDLSFFFESLGFRVIAIDHPDTNYNGMRGIRKLKAALNSSVEIVSADIDSRFELPPVPFDLVIFLGILYHLKNPYYILELLARHARFCILSTRVARFTPDGVDIRGNPLAYLLEADELNHDQTNFWIFSEAGLKRLLRRTGWEVCSYLTLGPAKSRPDTLEHDQRAFCLLRNRRKTDPGLTAGLLQGWHELEDGHRRWTERVFSVELTPPDPASDAILDLEFIYSDALKERVDSVRIQATIAGTPLPAADYSTSGIHLYTAAVPARLLRTTPVVVRFELSQAIPPGPVDRRELGLIVSSVGFR